MPRTYSVRPTPEATVSAPIDWDELVDCEPRDFTLATMPARSRRSRAALTWSVPLTAGILPGPAPG